MKNEDKVKLFIQTFKLKINNNDVEYQFKRKTTMFLREIGWTTTQASKYIIDSICTDAYFRGPTPHHSVNEALVMEFGMVLEEKPIYVKICIAKNGGAFLSFHPAEKELEFPLKK